MTIREAHAANDVARQVIELRRKGVPITPDLEYGISILLINAHKVLRAGYNEQSFLKDMKAAAL